MDERSLQGLRNDPHFPWPTEPLSFQSIDAGEINHAWRMDVGEQHFFVKRFSARAIIPVDRASNIALQKQLAMRGLAIMPVFLSSDQQYYIEHWCDISPFDGADVGRAIDMSAKTLLQIHQQQDLVAQTLPLLTHWQVYLEKISQHQDSRYWQQRIEQLSPVWLEAEKQTLCHHDLSFGHICEFPQGVILDWEYAGLSNRYFDLANCSLINQLTATQQNTLIHVYAQLSGISEAQVKHQYHTMLPLAELTAQLWYQAIQR